MLRHFTGQDSRGAWRDVLVGLLPRFTFGFDQSWAHDSSARVRTW